MPASKASNKSSSPIVPLEEFYRFLKLLSEMCNVIWKRAIPSRLVISVILFGPPRAPKQDLAATERIYRLEYGSRRFLDYLPTVLLTSVKSNEL
jgi:hypothetical protein